MDSAHSIPILPELEEADGGEASEEKASNDDQKTTFFIGFNDVLQSEYILHQCCCFQLS